MTKITVMLGWFDTWMGDRLPPFRVLVSVDGTTFASTKEWRTEKGAMKNVRHIATELGADNGG